MPDQPQIIVESLQEMLHDLILSLPSIIAALVILILSLYLARLVRRAVQAGLKRRTGQAQPVELVTQLAYWSVILLGTIAALQQLGLNLTAFLAGLGLAGIVIGFALQDVSKNFVAGVLMLIQQPFNTGDVIEVSGFAGTVKTVDLRATHLSTFDGRLVLIPNGEVYISPITNFTQVMSRRVEITIGVASDSDPDKVRQVALDAIRTVPGLSQDPKIEVLFQNLGGSTFDLTVYYWIDTDKTNPPLAKDAGLAAIKRAFQTEKIEIPLPIQTFLMKQ